MIPILFEKTETAFNNNGLGRLRDCISCVVTEERNGIYECDFELPVTSSDYKDVQIGRIIGVTHDDSDDIQPFDIVSYTKPIDGIVTFHAVHISYRQSYMTVTGSNINSLSDAFDLLTTAEPSNPFTYNTDKTSSGFLACADGIPRTVRQMLGGIEGSILDTYGGEYEWDKWTVLLHNSRGVRRDFSIRYGVNMTEYNDELDNLGPYSSCIPYWQNGDVTVVGNRVDLADQTLTGRGECVPLDLTDKFENQPTTAELETAAASYMSSNQTYLPAQTINVSFARLQDMGEYTELENLYKCGLCDTINVVFPDYDTKSSFKIVKTEWNVLMDRYESMELGSLSVTLSEALGLDNTLDRSTTNNAGIIESDDASVAITTADINTYSVGPSITLGAGSWVIIGIWQFNSVSGARVTDVDLATDSSTSASTTTLLSRQRVSNAAGNWVRLETTSINRFTGNTTVYVKGSATVTSTAQTVVVKAMRIS